MFDQAAAPREMARQKRGLVTGLGYDTGCQVVAVTSGKGGVGKTNVVVNVAIALQRSGQRVAILDADFGLGNVDVFFGLTPTYHVGHVVEGSRSLRSIIQEESEGVHIIPASSGIQELTKIGDNHREKILLQLSEILNHYDFLLIDTASGISDNVMSLLTVSRTVVVVSMPEPTAILDAYALIKVLLTRNHAKEVLLVMNSVRNRNEANQVFQKLAQVVERFLGQPLKLLGFVLKDEKVPQAVRQQVPLLVSHPGTRVSRCFTQIADSLLSASFRKYDDV